MRVFKDEMGHEWGLHIDVGTIARIRREYAIDLSKALASREAIEELSGDVVKLVDVLWGLVEPQAKTAGINAEAFASRLLGDSIEQAVNALIEAIIDFFPLRRRELLRQIWNKGRELNEAKLSEIEKQISGALSQDTQQLPESIPIASVSEK